MTAVDLQLNDDGTCSVAVTTDGVADEESCSWTASGTAVTVFSSDGGIATGSISNGTLTLTDDDGEVFVFVKGQRESS